MSVLPPNITQTESACIREYHDILNTQKNLAVCSTVAAVFLSIGALIVIFSSCMCLMLPGVNALTHVIYPAVIPGVLAIVTSLPCILLSVKFNLNISIIREQMVNKMFTLIDTEYKIPTLATQKERIHFILLNFFDWQLREIPEKERKGSKKYKLIKNYSWTDEYQKKILMDIKEKVGKDKKSQTNIWQKNLGKTLDEAMKTISETVKVRI